MNQANFVFILGSSRVDGNTEQLARRAAEGLPETVTLQWLRLNEHPLPVFEDIRHHETRKYEIASEQRTDLPQRDTLGNGSCHSLAGVLVQPVGDHKTISRLLVGLDAAARRRFQKTHGIENSVGGFDTQ